MSNFQPQKELIAEPEPKREEIALRLFDYLGIEAELGKYLLGEASEETRTIRPATLSPA